MADTYTIANSPVPNDMLNEWKDRLYQEFGRDDLLRHISNNNIQLRGVSRADIQKLRDDERVLVKIQRERTETMPIEADSIRERIRELEEDLTEANSDRRLIINERREAQNDLDDLQSLLDESNQRREDVRQELRDLGFTPPIISDQAIEQQLTSQSDKDRARELRSELIRLNTQQIPSLERDVEDTRSEVESLRRRENGFEGRVQALQEEIAREKARLDDLEPDIEQTDVLVDIIMVCETSFETYIHGEYRDNEGNVKRRIEGRGTKTVVVGVKAPKSIRDNNNEQQFWDRIYDLIRTQIIANEGSNDPGGEWFDGLLDTMAAQTSWASRAGLEAELTDPHWTWDFDRISGSHEFPDKGDFINDVVDNVNRCESWDDVIIR